MILNETKPPLEEALVHYGVPGMKWGRRRSQSRESMDYDDYEALVEKERRQERNKRIIAGGILAVAGTVAVGVALHQSGHIKVSPELIAKSRTAAKAAASKIPGTPQEERSRAKDAFRKAKAVGDEYDDAYRDAGRKAYGAYKNSNFAKRTFRPENVGNPLWTVNPRPKKSKSSGLDAGLAESAMKYGAYKIHTMDKDIWATPASFYTNKKR